MTDIIIIAVLLVVTGLAALYIYRAKKRGQRCIGCSAGGCCSKGEGGCSGCCACNHTQE